MGTKCSCIAASGSSDEAEDALLGNVVAAGNTGDTGGADRRQRQATTAAAAAPRGPPPPYQAANPFYMLTDEQRLQIVSRIALIQSLPVGRYESKKTGGEKKNDKPNDTTRECPICMNDFIPGEYIRLLPCMHFYHIRCIDNWLMRAVTCPTCVQRVDIATAHHHRPHHRRSSSQGSLSNLRRSSETLLQQRPSPPVSPRSSPTSPLSSPQRVTVEVHQ